MVENRVEEAIKVDMQLKDGQSERLIHKGDCR